MYALRGGLMIYPEIDAFYKKMAAYHRAEKSYDAQYSPARWLEGVTQDGLAAAFARYVRFLFGEADKGAFWEDYIGILVGEFYYRAVERGLYPGELSRGFALFNTLFLDCRYMLSRFGEDICGASRGEIELTIDAILTPHKVAALYREQKDESHKFTMVAISFRNEAAADYLQKVLKGTDSLGKVEFLLRGLRNNRVQLDFAGSAPYVELLIRYFTKSVKDQYNLLQYLQVTSSAQFCAFLQLAGLENVYAENRPMLEVTRRKVEAGEPGLIKLFYNTADDEVKIEILKCYKLFCTKAMAALAVDVLHSNYPEHVRKRAYTTLYCDTLEKLTNWFGVEVVELVDGFE